MLVFLLVHKKVFVFDTICACIFSRPQTALKVTLSLTESLSHSLTHSELADLNDVTLVSDDTFRRLGTWVTHDHLSSVID